MSKSEMIKNCYSNYSIPKLQFIFKHKVEGFSLQILAGYDLFGLIFENLKGKLDIFDKVIQSLSRLTVARDKIKPCSILFNYD